MAVNMEIKIPTPRVTAKPWMLGVPKKYKIAVVIKLETLESRILSHARAKPSSTALWISLPARISSLVRSKIKMLASTAMPTDKIKPAIPAKVKVTGARPLAKIKII